MIIKFGSCTCIDLYIKHNIIKKEVKRYDLMSMRLLTMYYTHIADRLGV